MPTSYLGIDLHKRSSTWVLLDQNRKVLLKQNVPCTPSDVASALYSLPVAPESVRAVVEPVCAWRWFSGLLMETGMDVRIANPLKTRLIAESKMKHDVLDARTLAELVKADFLPESYRASDDITKLRCLVRERKFFAHTRINVICRLHGLTGSIGQHTMSHHPMRAPGRAEIRASGNEELNEMLNLIEEIDAHMKPLNKQIIKLASSLPIPKLLMTMPGVGAITALTVYAEVGDFGRFPSAEKLTAYAGLVPSQRSSGPSTRNGHITRMGSRLLRTTVVEAAFAIRKNTDHRFYSFYKHLLPNSATKRGTKRARVALARKMLAIMWHMATNNTPYIPLSPESTLKRADLATMLAH